MTSFPKINKAVHLTVGFIVILFCLNMMLLKSDLQAKTSGLAIHESASEPGEFSSGQTYYVDNSLPEDCLNGNYDPDSRACRSGFSGYDCFTSIQAAIDEAEGGDVILVMEGVYSYEADLLSINKGNLDGPLTLKSQIKGLAVLDGRYGREENPADIGVAIQDNNILLEGFEIRNFDDQGIVVYGNNSRITHNVIHHIGRRCTDTEYGLDGIYQSGSSQNITYNGNIIHDIGRFAYGEEGCVNSNHYYQNHDHAIYIGGSASAHETRDIKITNNIFYTIQRGWPIHIFSPDQNHLYSHIDILNNVFHGENPYRDGRIIIWYKARDVNITNNIFNEPRNCVLTTNPSGSVNASIRHNIVSPDASLLCSQNENDAHSISDTLSADPFFSSEEAYNFSLTSESPAVDNGICLEETQSDIEGSARPRCEACDIGPYEYASCESVTNVIQNPNFEDGSTYWTLDSACYSGGVSTPECNDGSEEVVTDGCFSGKCLRMQHKNSTWQGASQVIGNLTSGKTYKLTVRFNTSIMHYGYINLYDPDWKDSDCMDSSKSFTKMMTGTGNWTSTVLYQVIPENDDCGESTAGHEWRVYLYSYYPSSDASPVYYDEVSLAPYTENIPAGYPELEEMQGWSSKCMIYDDNLTLAACNEGSLDKNYTDTSSGDYSLVLAGTKDNKVEHSITLPVKPGTTYRIKSNLRITDRSFYSYLNLSYPAYAIQQREGIADYVENTKGLWSGLYALDVDGVNMLQSIIKDSTYLSPSEIGWFNEESYFRTGSSQAESTIRVILTGFDGKLLIDNLTVSETDSSIDDRYFTLPITYEYQGMRIKGTSQEPLYVETNAAKFVFDGNSIVMQKGGAEISRITFLENILEGVTLQEGEGIVTLENSNLLISVGADSVMLTKLKRNATLSLSGPKPAFHNFEVGILFATDYSKGILFSPLRTKDEISTEYRYSYYDLDSRKCYYNDSVPQNAYAKNWEVLSDFSSSTWNVQYNLLKGEGFIAEIFPPKEFNMSKYCKERMHTIHLSPNTYPDADFSYHIQEFNELETIGLIWMNDYAVSINNNDPAHEYCLNSTGHLVHCASPSVVERKNISYHFDVTGPYIVGEPEALRRTVEEAHKKGMKIIIYMSPNYYYTSDVDIFLDNLMDIINDYSLDGVYYDGLYLRDALKNLELVRKTRNRLGDKFYAQHISTTSSLIEHSSNFRVPFQDAYADLIWNGESIKTVDEDTWKLNYCGQNVSNTVSMLLAELRPVLWARTKEESIAVTLLPEEQINRTLECNGIFRTNPYSRTSSIYDSNFQHHIYFNSSYFLDQYNSLCIGYTCGDGVCDIGESIYTCAADCIPKTGFRLVKNGDLCQCDTNYSVAQWISAGKPLYVLHFTFDNETMWDSSHNGLNPSRDIGVLKKPSSYASVDGRKAHYFNDSAMYGDHYRALDLTGKNFSSFARIKALAPQLDEHQILLHLNGAGHFYYSIKDSKLYVSVRNESYAQRTFASIGTIDTEWHTVGIVYERPLLKIYIDGAKDSQHTVNLFSFQESGKYYVGAAGADSTYNFTGYIDDLFIADRALTEQQVFEYYATGHKTVSLTADAQCVIEMLPDAATTEQRCGDGICYPDESCSSCTVDCGNCAIIPSTHIGEERGSGGGVTLPFINPGEDNIIQSVGTEAEGNESHPVTIQDPLHDHGSSIGQHGEFQLTDEYASPSITSWLSYGTSVKISWLVGIVLIPLLFLAITRLTRKAHHNLLLNKYIEHHLEKGYTLEEIEKAINDRLQKDKYTKEDREHLEAYIKSCLAGHYPKDAIIQACDTVGWDEELIKEIFEELALRVNNEKI